MPESLKFQTRQQAVRGILRLLPRISDENLIRLVTLGKWLSNDPEVLSAIEQVKRLLLAEGHPAKKLFRRVLEYLPADRRVKLFETLFNGAFFEGGKLRDRFERDMGYRPPFIMILSPTLQCNLRCKGCYTLGYGMRPELSFAVADRLLSECEALGIYFVTVLGGEPLMYPHLFALLERHPSIFFQVYTNGTLMTRDKARRFAELGNAMVVISIEGGERETDAWRGPGVYRKIMGAFEHLDAARVLIGTSATVTRQNADTVSSLVFIDRMMDVGSMAQMYFLYLPVNGQADFNLLVTPEQRNRLRKCVMTIRDERPIFVLDFWNDGPYVDGCIAGGRRYFHVNAKGDVEPCVYAHIAVDNIHDKPLAETLNSSLFQKIRSCQPHNPNHLRPCMIIDNPQVMREVIEEIQPKFTHEGAEEIYTVHKEEMDSYAKCWSEVADRVWQEEYAETSGMNNEEPAHMVRRGEKAYA